MLYLIALSIALSAELLNGEQAVCSAETLLISIDCSHRESVPSEEIWEAAESRDVLQEKTHSTDAVRIKNKFLSDTIPQSSDSFSRAHSFFIAFRGYRFPMLV